MEEESNKGLWAGLVIAAVLAIVFAALWFMRGGDVDRLTADIGASRTAQQRLEGDLRDARSQVESSARRVSELENQVKEESRRAADAAAGLERRLRSELDAATLRLDAANAELAKMREGAAGDTGEEKERILKELQNARDELSRTKSSGQDEIKRLSADLESANQMTAELEAKLADGNAALARLEADAKQARAAVRADTGDIDQAAATEIAVLKAELAKTAQALADAKQANASLETVKEKLTRAIGDESSAAAARSEELGKLIDSLRKELGSSRERSAAISRAADQAWRDRLARAEKEWNERAAALEAENAGLKNGAREKEAKALAERHAAVSRAADQAWRDRLSRAERESAAKIADAEKAATARLEQERAQSAAALDKALKAAEDRLKANRTEALAAVHAVEKRLVAAEKGAADRIARLETAGKEAAAKLGLLQTSYMRRDEEAKKLEAEVERLEKIVAEHAPGGAKFGLAPNGRSLGKIAGRLEGDGKITVIDIGVNQGVKEGMKLDVYRPVGEANRYVGMVRVIRAQPDSAMAVASYDEVNGLVCPKTGRAVLEPGARFSPYATGDDGKPLELVRADTVKVPLEAPAVGDLLDNPFVMPGKRLKFAIAPGAAADPCAVRMVETLGGEALPIETAQPVDFVVTAGESENAAAAGARQITLDHLYRYVDEAYR